MTWEKEQLLRTLCAKSNLQEKTPAQKEHESKEQPTSGNTHKIAFVEDCLSLLVSNHDIKTTKAKLVCKSCCQKKCVDPPVHFTWQLWVEIVGNWLLHCPKTATGETPVWTQCQNQTKETWLKYFNKAKHLVHLISFFCASHENHRRVTEELQLGAGDNQIWRLYKTTHARMGTITEFVRRMQVRSTTEILIHSPSSATFAIGTQRRRSTRK